MGGVRTAGIFALLFVGALRSADLAPPKEAVAAFAFRSVDRPGSVRPRVADLTLTKTDSPDPVAPGQNVTYTIQVSNNGPDTARSITVTDNLPTTLTFVSCASTSGGVCSGSGGSRKIKFNTLQVGSPATITLVAQVQSSVPSGSQIANTASVRLTLNADTDPDPGNNSGTALTTVLVSGRATEGEWSPPVLWPLVAIHVNVLPDGRLLVWDGSFGAARVWDPATGIFTKMPNTTNSIFCAGHSFLADGRLFVAGGHLNGSSGGIGSPDANIFNHQTNNWTALAPMTAGRWYPTATTLPNGDVLVLSGQQDSAHKERIPLVWHLADGTWRQLVGAQQGMLLYPRIHVAPNGLVFHAGPERDTQYLDTSGNGAWIPVGPLAFNDERDYGTVVMYDDGKVLNVGGGGRNENGPGPTNTAEVIDLIGGGGWRFTNPMAFARRQLNATILADGKVLVTGGTSSAGFNNGTASVYAAEIWNPETEVWTTVASMQVRRLYHSTAVLLPDARVLSAGGFASYVPLDPPDVNHKEAEIYSPPYLFAPDGSLATRPVVTSAPAAVAYGETFFVGTAEAVSIGRVNLIRLSSVTHSVNMTQRVSHLTFSVAPGGGGLDVTAPGSPNLAPPGPYMLFILDGNGVPSVAKVILLG